MKKFYLLLTLLIILAGCTPDNEVNGTSITEVEFPTKDEDIQEYIQMIENKNGYYLFGDGSQQFYIILIGSNVESESGRTVFEKFNVKPVGNVLEINVQQHPAPSNTEHDPASLVIYKVKKSRSLNTDTLNLFVNGDNVPFNGASGR